MLEEEKVTTEEKQEETEFGESEETTEETQEETQESSTEETESSDKLKKAVEGAEDLEEEKEEEPEKKSPVQKRIDRITAEKYQALEKKARLEERVKLLEAKSEKKEDRFFSSSELDQAERKAITENDVSLMADVNKERLRNLERNMVARYEKDQAKVKEAKSAQGAEWTSIQARWSDDEDADLDIRNRESSLFKIAKQYFEDPEMKAEYSGLGGMERAVADAFKYLTLARRNKKSPKVKKLERKVAKERSKTQLSAGSSGKEAKTSKPVSKQDDFNEYVQGHRARQKKATLGV